MRLLASSCGRGLSELDVRVEEQINNVLVTLRLWIKSFIFTCQLFQYLANTVETHLWPYSHQRVMTIWPHYLG